MTTWVDRLRGLVRDRDARPGVGASKHVTTEARAIVELAERIERLEDRLDAQNEQISALDNRTIGDMMIGPG